MVVDGRLRERRCQDKQGTERNEAVIKRLMPVVSFVTVICILSETKKKKRFLLLFSPSPTFIFLPCGVGDGMVFCQDEQLVGRTCSSSSSIAVDSSSSSSSSRIPFLRRRLILFFFIFYFGENLIKIKLTATAVRTYGYARRIFCVTDYLTTISLLARLDWPLKSRTSVCLLPPPQPLVKIASLYWSNVKEWGGVKNTPRFLQ